ncbi:MAG: alpha-2,8-polysialyltransferase family protein [Clostridiaceae bacterium]|nr:alpha-2,8-polysialyltransferase family protein [Clostridiaceae bacterium]MBW4859667.1 alpha-2,8-polysialyltransferase family protein [Clostridiaceae bacterium]MBW4868788.1 alpha-2,8-polysialyltransferase family protein [Clostridiaceae bacterium]
MNELVDACYFCTTPYQILGAISLVLEREEKADLYIVGQFSSFNKVAKRIEQKNIFRKVIAIDEYEVLGSIKCLDNKILKRLLMSKQYLKVKDVGDSILDQNVTYKKMYLTCQAFIIRLVYFYLLEFHNDVEFIYFDDGVGSYYDSDLFKIRFPDKVMRLLLFGEKAVNDDFKRLLYMPELYSSFDKKKVSNLAKMPKIDANKISKDTLNFIFNFKNKDIINEEVIIFDTLKEELYGAEGSGLLNNYYKIIYSYFGKNNVIIKSHPRSKDIQNNEFNYYNNYEIPSEIIYLNMDIEQSILITTASTAVLTPKFIMDREPIIIMLYKLMEKFNTVDEEQDIFFRKVRQTYRDKNKFNIPEDEIELKNILERIKKRHDK